MIVEIVTNLGSVHKARVNFFERSPCFDILNYRTNYAKLHWSIVRTVK